MPEHFTLATVSSEFYCPKCKRMTQHRIDQRRKGPCLDCIAKLELRKFPKVEVKIQFEVVTVGPICTCPSFPLAHESAAHFDVMTTMERKGWTIWTNAGQESYTWPGWAELGTKIRYRRTA